METIDTIYDEYCRLCLCDLSQLPEYYAIDEGLQMLVNKLTEILIDLNDSSVSKFMCPNCFNILEDFNKAKLTWAENQENLFDSQKKADEDDEKSDEIECTDIIEDVVKEDYNMTEELDFTVEYVEDLVDLNETDQIESSQFEEIPPSPPKKKSPKTKSNLDDSKDKGKDVYQKLLKKCEECGKMIEKNRLEGHLNKHADIRPYQCEEENCGKRFHCKLLYRLHKTSIHTGISISCDVCQKSFPSQRALYAHNLRHKNSDRYKCDVCERRFNNNNSLKRHFSTHTGIREWKCELCQAAFYRKFNLDVHVRTVHEKDKSYACNQCSKRFGYSRLLREHIKKSHPEPLEV